MRSLFASQVTHWQSPHMHAYFPALTSPPSMLGDMLANAMGMYELSVLMHGESYCIVLYCIKRNRCGRCALVEIRMTRENST